MNFDFEISIADCVYHILYICLVIRPMTGYKTNYFPLNTIPKSRPILQDGFSLLGLFWERKTFCSQIT